jgi:hypothetical protein
MAFRLPIVLVATATLLQTGVSRAVAIDGDWCSPDIMPMSIRTEKITIPNGKQMDGNDSRHAATKTSRQDGGSLPGIPIEPIPHQDKFGATGKANAAEVRTSQGEKQ